MNNIYKWQIKIIVVYCFSSKYALIFLLKECTDDEHFTVSGRLFHILGPLTLISLSPVSVRVGGTNKLFCCLVALLLNSLTLGRDKSLVGS